MACAYEAIHSSETDAVLTIRDEGREYSGYKTYALTDRVHELCGILPSEDTELKPGEEGEGGREGLEARGCVSADHKYDADVLAAVERNLKELGYTRVASVAEDPDLVVLVGVITRQSWNYSPRFVWCDPYYSYSCWYPDKRYSFNLPTDGFVINWIDHKESKTDDLSSVWFASLHGFSTNFLELSPEQRVNRSVDLAFEQSPYLAEGGAR